MGDSGMMWIAGALVGWFLVGPFISNQFINKGVGQKAEQYLKTHKANYAYR
jgi:hypothetical protein